MKTMKRMMAVVVSMALAGSVIAVQAQEATAPATATRKKAAKKAVPAISEQLSEMKQAIDAQQQQIKQLSDLIQTRDQKIQQLEQRLDQSQTAATQAQAKADSAAAQTADQGQAVMALKGDVTDLKSSYTNTALTLQETQKRIVDNESPLAIHVKGITITPGGFMAAETVYRNRALGSDINTGLNNVNFPGSGANTISEFFGSGRQSRVSMLAEGKFSDVKLSGYVEADFLSSAITSNNNQSNSYALRQRQAWGQAAFTNGWTLTGGQMWSLVTETKKGTDVRSEALPMTIDAQYTVGFSWARQWGLRVAKNFDNRVWLAASLENPQTTFAQRGNDFNFALGSPGLGAGLYNGGITGCSTVNNPTPGGNPITTCSNAANYSFNATPDLILKAAFEPGFGHYEIFGVLSRFRDRVYPCQEGWNNPALQSLCGMTTPSATGAYNASVNGGGVGANARVTLFKQVDFGLHALMGNGVGRYGDSGLPDATVKADGTLAPLRSYQGLATLEWHTPRIDVYLNGGEEYVERRWEADAFNPVTPGTIVGYGSPLFKTSGCYKETLPSQSGTPGYNFGSLGGCSADTQSTIEGTFGFWIKLHSGPKGRLQFGPQYSYLVRNAWAGTAGAPHGIDNMFFTSFRYYLP
jgi:flagellar motor protein MotB